MSSLCLLCYRQFGPRQKRQKMVVDEHGNIWDVHPACLQRELERRRLTAEYDAIEKSHRRLTQSRSHRH